MRLVQARGLKCLGSWACLPIEGSLSRFVSLYVALLRWVLWCCQRSSLVVEHTSGYRTFVCCKFPPFGNCRGCATVIAGSLSALWNRPRAACGRNPAPLYLAFLSHPYHLRGLQGRTESRRAVLSGQGLEDINRVYGQSEAFTPMLQLLLCLRASACAKLYGAAWKQPRSRATTPLDCDHP